MRTPTRPPEVIDLRERGTDTQASGVGRLRRLEDVRVAVVGCIDEMTYNVAASLGYAGLHVEVLTPHAGSRLARSRWCRGVHLVPPPQQGRFPDDMLPIVRNVVRAARIDLVVAADYDTLAWLADHESALGRAVTYPTPTRAQIERCNDKWQLMQLCAALGIEHPITELIERPSDVATCDGWGRVVVKPLSSGFSYGVYELDADELADHLRRDDRPGNELPLLVQEFVPGDDVDVTVLVDHGRVVSGVVQERIPSRRSMRFSSAPEMLAPIERLAAATSFHGVMDFDLRRDPSTGRIAVIECNPRFPGSLITKTWAGCNLALDGVALAVGFPITATPLTSPVTYRSPSASGALLALRASFWRGEHTPTRVGWASRLRDPRYALATVRAKGAG